jgi:serine phosphatase RsbU (regulator of sigma subunit)
VTVGSTRLLNASQAIDEARKEVLAAIATFDHFIDTLQQQVRASAHQSAHTLLGLAKLLPIVVLALGLGALAISYFHSTRTARSLDAGMKSILQGIEGVRSGRSDLLLQVQEPSEFRLTASFLADVARERDESDKAIQQLLQESEAARSILAEEREVMEGIFLAMRETKQYDGRHVRDLQVPVERTSGDVLFSAFRPDGTQHVFLGDFTGHGLTAALGGPLVSDVFYTMTRKGFEATQLIEEMSARLAERLPVGVFLAAIMVTISPDRKHGSLVNCGMQDALLFRNKAELHRFRSNNLALGITADMPISEDTLTLDHGDKLYLFSDGLVEVEDEHGRQFGVDRLSQAISDMLQHDGILEDVEAAAMRFGHLEIAPDDKTMAEVTC